jgi:hypothetical protein
LAGFEHGVPSQLKALPEHNSGTPIELTASARDVKVDLRNVERPTSLEFNSTWTLNHGLNLGQQLPNRHARTTTDVDNSLLAGILGRKLECACYILDIDVVAHYRTISPDDYRFTSQDALQEHWNGALNATNVTRPICIGQP